MAFSLKMDILYSKLNFLQKYSLLSKWNYLENKQVMTTDIYMYPELFFMTRKLVMRNLRQRKDESQF